MSVVSRSRASKPPSVISTHRNGGTSTMQYETASQASRVPRTTVNSQSVSSRPINAITIPSSSTKGKVLGDQEITEEEMEHLAEVCRRCELLQRQEDERIKSIREQALSKERARRGITKYDDEHCAICSAAFVRIFNGRSTCVQCERFVCRNCVKQRYSADDVLCKTCFSECTNKARTGLWFTEKLQVAKKDGRIIPLAPTSALRASIIRKKREQSRATSVVGPAPDLSKVNGAATDPVYEAAKRLTTDSDDTNNYHSRVTSRPDDTTASKDLSSSCSLQSRRAQSPAITDKRRRRSSGSSAFSSMRSNSAQPPVIQDARRRSIRSAAKPPLPKSIASPPAQPLGDQLAFNIIFSGVDDLPKTLPRTRSRQQSTSGYTTPNTVTGNANSNANSYYDGNNWESRSMVSAVSVGSVTSVYSEREESFTHGLMVTGDLSFSIDYDDKSGSLRVYVKQAREVAVADTKSGNSDTYVKTYLLPDKSKHSKRKTKVKKNTINPVFNEPLIYNIPKSDLAYRTLQISLWHHRHMKANLFLGEVLVPLSDYRFSSTPIWRALQGRNSIENQLNHQLTKGQLRLGLKYVPGPTAEEGELHVCIMNATGLNIPSGTSSDVEDRSHVNAYVKIHLLPDRPKASKRKTKVIKKSNSPTWDETLVYTGIPKTQLPSLGVEVVIWDDISMKHNEYLGGCNINTGSRSGYGMDAVGNERALWFEMMNKPNTMVEATVNLRSTMD